MTKNKLFDFDKKFACHCEEGQSPDAAIQDKKLDLPLKNDTQPFFRQSADTRNDVIIIGTDEAGRGPGAGGVFASAVYFNNVNEELIEKLSDLNDSKKLSKTKREALFDIICANSVHSTVCVEVEEIEKINILNASLKAMKLACENVIEQMQRRKEAKRQNGEGTIYPLSPQQNILILVDGNKPIKTVHRSQLTVHSIIKGDGKSASIAAASILAKVTRDRYMLELHKKFPQYNWAQNAGYLTKEHLCAIDRYGISPCHRESFLKKHKEKQCIEQLNLYQK